jgi:hypothetical protein
MVGQTVVPLPTAVRKVCRHHPMVATEAFLRSVEALVGVRLPKADRAVCLPKVDTEDSARLADAADNRVADTQGSIPAGVHASRDSRNKRCGGSRFLHHPNASPIHIPNRSNCC